MVVRSPYEPFMMMDGPDVASFGRHDDKTG